MDTFTFFIFYIAILLFSVVIHEVSHGAVANLLGDPTAKLKGRLTLNPIPHIDPLGTIILPIFSMIFFGFAFGWAKPVPYNPYNLSNPRRDTALVGFAGPASNFILAIVFGVALRFIPISSFGAVDSPLFPMAAIFGIIVFLNLLLGIFNLLPIPPLDGSKLLFALPNISAEIQQFLTKYGFFLLIFFIFFGFQFIFPVITTTFRLITGYSIMPLLELVF